MDEILYREELMWPQRSRVDCLKGGDRNTKYFHRRASRRQQKNKITKLKRPDGTINKDTKETEGLANDFFPHLYTRDEDVDPSEILNLIHTCIDEHMNDSLMAPFSEKVIGDTLFQIGPVSRHVFFNEIGVC
jgi:hypothetical protein